MHKITAIALILLIALAGCASNSSQGQNTQESPNEPAIEQQNTNSPSPDEVSQLDTEIESLSNDLDDSDFDGNEFTEIDENTFN